ncbi:MAG: rhomboid family intramembrane serine protease [Sphingobacteriia bacterium]|jgi:rhomboid-like protein|nr:rhomboid family intramembrane serine protease [Sphingobacteriia bacterium]
MFTNLTPVVKNLVIINGIVFAFLFMINLTSLADLQYYFLLFKNDWILPRPAGYAELFKPVQLVTHFFAHKEIFHILFNMMALISLGTGVEYIFGSKKFLEFYLFCGFVGGILITTLDPSSAPVLGASGAISGVIVAFAFFFPKERLSVFFLPPIEARWVATAIAALSAIFVFTGTGGSISHFGHLAGMVAAAVYLGFYQLKAKL